MRTFLQAGAALLAAAVYATPSYATVISYPDFSSTAGLTLVGDANNTNVPNQLQLTPASSNRAGAAYSTTPIALGSGNSFSTQFQFQFTNPGGVNPADGITFVLAASPSGLGSSGGGLGYAGTANSVAIEFDTYNNGASDGNSSNHVAIDEGGALSNNALADVYGINACNFGAGYTQNGCMSNGHIWTVNISYNGTLLNASVTDPANGSAFAAISNYSIDIGSLLGTNVAYVGFTGSTGGGYESQNILSWTFSNTASLPPSTSVPEPSTLVLALPGIGFLAALGLRRRSRATA